jgi:hypothetical protein
MKNITIGSLQHYGFEASKPQYGIVWQYATEIIISAINNSTEILQDVNVVLDMRDTLGEKYYSMELVLDMVQRTHVAAIFGAMKSSISKPTRCVQKLL